MKTGAPTAAELKRALFRTAKRTNPETPIMNSCIEYLNLLPGITVWRQNTGGKEWVDAEGKRRVVLFGVRGQSDIGGVQRPQGRWIQIEVKVPGEEPTPEQRAWLLMALQHGAVAFWVDSLDGCIEQARKWGLGS